MFGEYAGEFFSGLRDQQERLLGRRQKAAFAFAQFKAQNPTATYAEFQQFVDSMSGGDHYLRGGMPTEQVLRELGKQGQERQRQEQERASLQELAQRQQRSQILDHMVRGAYESGIRDPLEIEAYAAENAGVQEDPQKRAALVESLRQMNLGSRIQKWDDDTLLDAKRKAAGDIQNDIINEEADLSVYLPEHMRKTHGKDFASEVGQNLKQHAARQNTQLFGALLPKVVGMIESGGSPETVEAELESMRPGNPNNARLAKELFAQAQKEWQLKVQAQQEQKRAQFLGLIDRDPRFSRIAAHNPALARSYMQERAKLIGLPEGLVDYDQLVSSAASMFGEEQDAEYQQRIGQLSTIMPKLVDDDMENARGVVKARFGAGSPYGENPSVKSVMDELSQTHYFSPSDIDAAENVIASLGDKEVSPAQLRAEILKAASPMTTSEYSRQKRDAIVEQVAAPEDFGDFVSGSTQVVSDGFQQISDMASKATSAEDIQRLRILAEQKRQQLLEQIAMREQAPFMWVRGGGEPYDPQQMRSLKAHIDAQYRSTLARLVEPMQPAEEEPRSEENSTPRKVPRGQSSWQNEPVLRR